MHFKFKVKRFWQLWQNFHLIDVDESRQPARTDECHDKPYKLRPIILTEKFKVYYIGQEVCVDEHMVKGRGKKSFKATCFHTTNQNEHQNLRIGLFMLWIFAWFSVYTGRTGEKSAPAFPPTLFHASSVSLLEQGLFKFGRCHHCCIGVKGA